MCRLAQFPLTTQLIYAIVKYKNSVASPSYLPIFKSTNHTFLTMNNMDEMNLIRNMDGNDFVLFRTDKEGRILVKQPGGVVPHFSFVNGSPKMVEKVAVSWALLADDNPAENDSNMSENPLQETDSWLWKQVAVFPMISALILCAIEIASLIIMTDWTWRQYYGYVTQPYNVGMTYMYHILVFLVVALSYGASSYATFTFAHKCINALMRLASGGKHKNIVDSVENAIERDVFIDPNMNFVMRYSQKYICYAVKASKYLYFVILLIGFSTMFGLLGMCLYSKPIPVQEIYSYLSNAWVSLNTPAAANFLHNAYRPNHIPPATQAPPMGAMNVPPFRR